MNLKDLFPVTNSSKEDDWPLCILGFCFIVDVVILPFSVIGLVAKEVLK